MDETSRRWTNVLALASLPLALLLFIPVALALVIVYYVRAALAALTLPVGAWFAQKARERQATLQKPHFADAPRSVTSRR